MTITDEMLAVAKNAAVNRLMSDDGCPEGEALRAALEAAAPMIRAAALEDAAKVADGEALARTQKLSGVVTGVLRAMALNRAAGARDVAAAIRALGGSIPPPDGVKGG